MKKFVFAACFTFAFVGWVMADEFNLQITKISDNGTMVTGFKAKAGGKGGKGGKGGFGGGFGKGEEVTVKIASGVQVYKGKFDTDSKSFVKDGDDLKLAGLKSALSEAAPASVTVSGNKLADNDKLELTIKDGKLVAKLNGKDIDVGAVQYTPKAPVQTRVTTDDNGVITNLIIIGGFGGKKKNDK
jgi:hypothetical protein